MTDQIKQALEDLNRDWKEFKTDNNKRLDELAKGKADVVLIEKVDRINDAMTAISLKQDDMVRQEKLDDIANDLADIKERVYSPQFNGDEKEPDEHTKAFIEYMRDGEKALELKGIQKKAVTIGTDSAGGYAVPAPIAQEIFSKILDISPIVSAVLTTPVTSPLYERLVDVLGAASGWAGEGTSRSDKSTPALAQVTFNHGELYAVPKVSLWSLNDMMFDVAGWVTGSVAKEFAYQLGDVVTTGSGSNRPTGFVGTPVVGADDGASPTRAFGTLQYLPTGAASSFQLDYLTGSPQGDPWAVFINLFAAFKPAYLNNAQFSMRRSVEAVLRKLRDQDANYYWAPSVAKGLPNLLWGYNIIPNESQAAVGANTYPVAFGDFKAGYELISIHNMTMIRDDVTAKGHVLYYMAQRWGGAVTNDDAIKLIKCSVA